MNVLSPASPPPRRWLRRCLLGSVVAVVVLIALAPSLVEWFPALRDRLIAALVGRVNGTVAVDSLSAGWFEPVVVRGLRVVHPSKERVIEVEQIETDRRLWQMVWTPSDLGTIRVERPIVSLDIRQDGDSFNDIFAPAAAGPKQPKGFKLGAKVRLVDGTFRCRSHEYAQPWEITGINIGVGWRPASQTVSGKPELLVDRGTLLDHETLSVGLCNDLLSFAAPVLARVAYAQGSVSVELGDWRLPIGDPASGELSGRITMHTVDVGPGPLVQHLFGALKALPLISRLTSEWQLPTAVQLARESVIPFELVGGRIHHQGMRFSLLDLVDVETDGYVGFDKSLDLTASLGFHPPNPDERVLAVMRVLTTQKWPVKIHGKLGAPEVDLSPLGDAGIDLAAKTMDDIRAGRPSLGADAFHALNDLGIPIGPNEVQRLIELARPKPTGTSVPPTSPPIVAPATPPPPSPSGTAPGDTASTPPPPSPAAEGIGIAVDVLQGIRARREAAEREAAANAPPGAPPPPRRPLRQGLRMLLDAAEDATSAPPPPAPPLPAPPPPAPNPPPAAGTKP